MRRLLLGYLPANFAASVIQCVNVHLRQSGKQQLLERVTIDCGGNECAGVQRDRATPSARRRAKAERRTRKRVEIDRGAGAHTGRRGPVNMSVVHIRRESAERQVVGKNVGCCIQCRRKQTCSAGRIRGHFIRPRQRRLERGIF